MSPASADHHIVETAKGSGFLAAGAAFEFAARFGIALVLAWGLGVTGYGTYILAVSLAGLCAGIALLGLDDAMVRYVAIHEDRRDRAGVWGTVEIGFGTSAATGIVVGVAAGVGAGWVAGELLDVPTLASLLRAFIVVVPVLTVSAVLSGILRGLGRMDHAALAEKGVQSGVRLALMVVVFAAGRLNLTSAFVVFAVSDIAASIAMVLLLRRTLPFRKADLVGARRDPGEVFRFAFPLWLSGLIRQFRRSIEVLLLGSLATATSVGVFSVINKVNQVGHVSLWSLLVAVKPVIARLHDRKDPESLTSVYVAATRWSFALYVPFFLVVLLYPEAILSVFGSAFTTGATALVILATGELANAATGICGSVIDMTGHTMVKLINAIAWAVLLIGGSALLIPGWGVLGAAVASLIAMTVVNVARVIEVWILEGTQPYDRAFLKPVAAGTAALVFGLALDTVMPVGDRFGFAAFQGVLVATGYAVVLVALGLADDDRLVLERVLSRVRSRRSRGSALARTIAGGEP
jgi:O-antigen/teichoic acid export membrane protein